MKCPCCNRNKGIREVKPLIYQCPRCEAIFGNCYLGESFEFVLPYFVKEDVPAEQTRYFDFTCLGSEGITRRHGWFDPESKRIVQVG